MGGHVQRFSQQNEAEDCNQLLEGTAVCMSASEPALAADLRRDGEHEKARGTGFLVRSE
jgi:hypothetical protein